MAYILKNQPQGGGSRRFAAFVALAGLILTIAQIGYISRTGNALCINGGCAVVESLTNLPPIYVNLLGALFFLTMLILVQLAGGGKGGCDGHNFWSRAAGGLLLAAMAIEGALLSFQLQVSRVWCSYCLMIFACVFLLNLSLGWRRFLRGLTALVAVIAASASLDYASSTTMSDSGSGSRAEISRPQAAIQTRLYFSAACPHCEEIIASLDENISCGVGFYPLEPVPELRIAEARNKAHYNPAVNRAMLQGLGIHEVPTLMATEVNEIRIITGKDAILAYLERCRPAALPLNGQSPATSGRSIIVHPVESDDESCPIGVACPPPTSAPR
ncbi:MAG: vitamin K epoxide reductase family protein [Desulfobulbaceae bacterium]|jgi:uncharacterized membrane protein|nr:vitamin K epoxide reductase family protein [Desulfobulbaceae bacterium]